MQNSEKRVRDGAKPRKRKRQLKKDQQAGGAWGDGFRERLRSIMRTEDLTQAALAEKCGVGTGRVTEWLAGNQIPSAESLRALSETTEISLDWLFFGDRGAEPRRRTQARTDSELEEDLASAVARAASLKAERVFAPQDIRPRRIIKAAAARVIKDEKLWRDWVTKFQHMFGAHGNILRELLIQLADLPPLEVDPDAKRTVARLVEYFDAAMLLHVELPDVNAIKFFLPRMPDAFERGRWERAESNADALARQWHTSGDAARALLDRYKAHKDLLIRCLAKVPSSEGPFVAVQDEKEIKADLAELTTIAEQVTMRAQLRAANVRKSRRQREKRRKGSKAATSVSDSPPQLVLSRRP